VRTKQAGSRNQFVAIGFDGGRMARELGQVGIPRQSVSDSGEGRWTIQAAIDEAVPVLFAALYAGFVSRGEGEYQNKLLVRDAIRFLRPLGKECDRRVGAE
jgi:6-phosphogluconate dehydrogenase (decarboxylating)